MDRKDFQCLDKPETQMIWCSKDEMVNMDLRPSIARNIYLNEDLLHIVISE